MGFNRNNKYFQWGLTVFSVIAACMLLYFLMFRMYSLKGLVSKIIDITMPIIYGAVMAYIFHPVVEFLENRIIVPILKGMHVETSDKSRRVVRLVCVLFTIFLVLLSIYVLLALMIPELIKSIIRVIEDFPTYLVNIQTWFSELLQNKPKLMNSVNEIIDTFSLKFEPWLVEDMLPQINSVFQNFTQGIKGLVTFVKNLAFGFIISAYILYRKEFLIGNIKKALYATFKLETANQIIKDTQFIDQAFGGYFLGRILDSVLVTVLCYVGLLFLDMPYKLLISVIVGVTNMIPYIGPFLGTIPCALLIFMVSPMQALYFVIFIIILQQIDGNIISPMILNGVTGLTGFLVVVSVVIGGGLFGVVGMFVSVPVCIIICTITRNFLDKHLIAKELPTERDFYTDMDHIDTKTIKPIKKKSPEINPREVFCYKHHSDRR